MALQKSRSDVFATEVPAIHDLLNMRYPEDVDARVKPGHDEGR